MTLRRLITLAVLAGLLGAATVALAQSTGGSMGGGSFSGGGGGGGGGWSGGGGGSSWGGSSSSYSGGGSLPTGVVVVIISGIVLFAIIAAVANRAGSAGGSAGGSKLDVSVLRVGLDWNARKHVQQELTRIANTCNTATTAGLVAMLREVALTLRRSRDSWVYAGVVNSKPAAPHEAESLFRAQALRAREGFKHELVRAHDGRITTAAVPAALAARPDEGPGLVVITIVVAARTSIVDFHDPSDAEEVRRWLEAISQLTTYNLAAVEVIWTPAAEDDRMSSVELEMFNPEMKRIRSGTIVGKMDCPYCGGRFPAELLSCPHCGAKVQDAA